MTDVADRVRETSITAGVGTLSLIGAVTDFRAFSAAFVDGTSVYYCIELPGTGAWEIGIGTYSAGTLTRDTVLASSNAGALVNFAAGTKNVFCTLPGGGISGVALTFLKQTTQALMRSTGLALGTMATQNVETLPSATGKNLLINGRFQINQRVYASSAVLAAGAYGHDLWKAGAGGGNYSFTQNAADTMITIAAGKTLIQVVEAGNVAGTAFVLSWTGTAQARYGVDSAAPSGAYSSSPVIITGQTVGTVMSVEFDDGTLGSVHLELGTIATAFPALSKGEVKALCMRYYEKSFPEAVAPVQNSASGAYSSFMAGRSGAVGSWTRIPFKVPKRITPATVTLYNPLAANAQVRDVGSNTDCSGTTPTADENGINLTCTGNASTVGGYNLVVHWMVEVGPS